MTKDEIQKNSEHWYNKYKDAEKRISELEAQIEKMKCCIVSCCEGCERLPKLYEAFDKEIKEK